MCFAQQRRALFRHLNVKKWSELVRFVTLLTWKCPSCHIGVHFFDILTSKSGPDLVCFVHFDLEMRFAPQGHALFRHLNFQKWSETVCFWHSWLGNVLRATAACTFSSLIWPAGSAPAALASLLFDPPEPQIIGTKTQWIATIPFRAPAPSLLTLSLFDFLHLLYFPPWLFPPLLFHLFKLPSINYWFFYYHLPVVPHKAVAEVSEQETYRRGWLLWITDGRVNPLIDRNVVGFVFVGGVAWLQWSPHPQLLDWVWCSAAVVTM